MLPSHRPSILELRIGRRVLDVADPSRLPGDLTDQQQSASSGPAVVGKATRGEVLRTLERRSQWVKVQQDGGPRGWVARRLLWGW